LRAGDGHLIQLFNGDGNNYDAQLKVDGKKVFAHIQHTTPNLNESSLSTLLVQSISRGDRMDTSVQKCVDISRGDRMDTSVQKCVELGITDIQPIYTQHSIPALKGNRASKKLEHWKAIAISAAEQSGRSVVPHIAEAQTLQDWLKTHWLDEKKNGTLGWALDPTATEALNAGSLQQSTKPVRHALLIGPESGLETLKQQALRYFVHYKH